MKKIIITLPIFWVLLLVDVVGTAAATYDYIKINQAEVTILQNQTIQAQAGKAYINCLIQINPKGNIPLQEKK